jgi:SAM-dependent methyltransferase
MPCRSCGSLNLELVLDLGICPPSNAYQLTLNTGTQEKEFPLRVLICQDCWLFQTEDYLTSQELFTSNYSYLSSTSTSWVVHSSEFVEQIIGDFTLTSKSLVYEVASNDGYLLQFFQNYQIPICGIEPTELAAKIALERGIRTEIEFLSFDTSEQILAKYGSGDLVIGNNVFAHVPDINDFTKALGNLLKPNGVIVLEFPHIAELLKYSQFDTIYHEHFSYFSLISAENVFKRNGLRIWKVEKLSTHGGSLRVYGCLVKADLPEDPSVAVLREEEKKNGLNTIIPYLKLQDAALRIKDELLDFFAFVAKEKKYVAAYGAAAKGNTLLNFCGITSDQVKYVVDAAESKIGKFLPGSGIPIMAPSYLFSDSPDYILILPWNLSQEISEIIDLSMHARNYKKVVAVPKLKLS